MELYEKLLKVAMKKKEDPKILFEQVATIQNWYESDSKKINKAQLIAVILKAAPEEYASVLTSEQEKQETNLTLSHLRAVMNKYYWKVYKNKSTKDDKDEDEMALSNQDGKKNEKAGNSGKKRFQGKCHNCGKIGHMAKDCWKHPANAHKRWDWYKNKNEVTTANAGTGKKSEELQLAGIPFSQYVDEFVDDDDDSELEKSVQELKDIHEEKKEEKEKEKNSQEILLKNVLEEKPSKIWDVSVLEDPEIFVVDTGATTHSTGNSKGLIKLKNLVGKTTKVGNGEKVTTKAIGKMPFQDQHGTKGTLNDVHLIPGAPFNLISGTKLLILGFSLTGNKDKLVYEKDGKKLTFDLKVKTPEGMLLAAKLNRIASDEVGGATPRIKTVSIQQAHEELGHMGEADTRKAASALGWTVTRGPLKKCEKCAIGKAKQKKIKVEEPKEKSSEVNGRVYLDLSRIVSPKAEEQPKRPNWCLVVDEKTQFKSSSFHETKAGMVEPICQKFSNWKEHGLEVKTIRMDNGGENKKLVQRLNSKDWKLYPKIEYTARDTPQHNHLVEVGFSTLYGRGRAMMTAANVLKKIRPIVAPKAFETATKLDGLILTEVDGATKPRVEHCIPAFAHHLRKWGEAGTVKIKTKT
ncbi:MAG: zinc finger CCHC domain-containing protein, partial [Bacteroidota bacterium]